MSHTTNATWYASCSMPCLCTARKSWTVDEVMLEDKRRDERQQLVDIIRELKTPVVVPEKTGPAVAVEEMTVENTGVYDVEDLIHQEAGAADAGDDYEMGGGGGDE